MEEWEEQYKTGEEQYMERQKEGMRKRQCGTVQRAVKENVYETMDRTVHGAMKVYRIWHNGESNTWSSESLWCMGQQREQYMEQ